MLIINMKVVILAGGFGTRISEESYLKPKPMIEVGDKPVLWHIMKSYSAYGFNDFIICCGYKAHMIKEYFADYYLHNCDVTFDFRNGNVMETHSNASDPWRVTLVDTGINTMTGGRIKRIKKYLEEKPFMLTYGDGVSNVNIKELVSFHKNHGKTATITTVKPESRFGVLDLKDNKVEAFREKVQSDTGWINAGFMVFQPEIIDYLENDKTVLEQAPLEHLAAKGQLMAYKHTGFWHCMDTQRDKQKLEEFWESGNAPWRVW